MTETHTFRVTANEIGDNEPINLIYKFAEDNNVYVFGVREHIGTSNEHFHFFLDTPQNTQSLRMKLSHIFKAYKSYGQRGGLRRTALKRYSRNMQEMFKYLCKGDKPDEPPCVVLNDFELTTEQILDYQKQYWEQSIIPKKTNPDSQFLEYFTEKCLYTFKKPQQVLNDDCTLTTEYRFDQSKMISYILDYYNIHTKSFRRNVIEQKLNLLYNVIVRKYEPEEFSRYEFYMCREIQQIFSF